MDLPFFMTYLLFDLNDFAELLESLSSSEKQVFSEGNNGLIDLLLFK
jgi:hypothetical protein